MATDNDSEAALRLNHLKYSKNIFSYLNINSIRKKFDSVRAAIVNYVDIFIKSFPTAQFAIDGFYRQNCGVDVELVYVRSYLPLRQLTKHKISSDIQAVVLKINLRKEKWFFLNV